MDGLRQQFHHLAVLAAADADGFVGQVPQRQVTRAMTGLEANGLVWRPAEKVQDDKSFRGRLHFVEPLQPICV